MQNRLQVQGAGRHMPPVRLGGAAHAACALDDVGLRRRGGQAGGGGAAHLRGGGVQLAREPRVGGQAVALRQRQHHARLQRRQRLPRRPPQCNQAGETGVGVSLHLTLPAAHKQPRYGGQPGFLLAVPEMTHGEVWLGSALQAIRGVCKHVKH